MVLFASILVVHLFLHLGFAETCWLSQAENTTTRLTVTVLHIVRYIR